MLLLLLSWIFTIRCHALLLMATGRWVLVDSEHILAALFRILCRVRRRMIQLMRWSINVLRILLLLLLLLFIY